MTDYNDSYSSGDENEMPDDVLVPSVEKELKNLRVALLNFILSLIVVTNATSAVVNQDLCEQAKEFTYMSTS